MTVCGTTVFQDDRTLFDQSALSGDDQSTAAMRALIYTSPGQSRERVAALNIVLQGRDMVSGIEKPKDLPRTIWISVFLRWSYGEKIVVPWNTP